MTTLSQENKLKKLKQLQLEIQRATVVSKDGLSAGILFDVFQNVSTLQGKQGFTGEKGDTFTFNDLTIEQKKELLNKDELMPTDEELLKLIIPLIVPGVDGQPGVNPSDTELLKLIRPLIPIVKNGETPSDARILALIAPLLPAAIPGKDGSPDSAKEIVTKLNSLSGVLDASVIKNLPTVIESRALPTISLFGGQKRGGVKDVSPGTNITLQKTDSKQIVSLKDTLTSAVIAAPHGSASLPQLVNVCYGTGEPPAASSVPEGTLYIKYI